VVEARRRYFIWLSYKGTGFCGWQIQPGVKTIQQILDKALSLLLREEILTTGAGRTDTGVHAKTFVAHFDTHQQLEIKNLLNLTNRLNRILPSDIAISNIKQALPEAHARFSATSRTYHYIISRRKDPFLTEQAWLMDRPLSVDAMQKAAKLLTLFSDFQSFTKSNSGTQTHICTIQRAQWIEDGHILRFEIEADRFLRNMVRAIVGTLVDVGLGKLTPDDFAAIIKSKDRRKAGYSAPACGLYLVNIEYPECIFQPA